MCHPPSLSLFPRTDTQRLELTSTVGFAAAVERRVELVLEETGSSSSDSETEVVDLADDGDAKPHRTRNIWFRDKKSTYKSAFKTRRVEQLAQ